MALPTINKKISEYTVDDIAIHCSEANITVARLCVDLDTLLKAEKISRGAWGAESDPDNHTRLRALGICLELLKLVGQTPVQTIATVQHVMAPGDIDRLKDIATELKGLESRLNSDSIQQGSPVIEATVIDGHNNGGFIQI